MAETLKEITENYEKLHRLQMIEMILKTTYDFVYNTVREVVENFDNYEDFDDDTINIIVKNVKENLAMLDKSIAEAETGGFIVKTRESVSLNH